MGRASQARPSVRAQRTTNGGLLIREPCPAEEAAVVKLLGGWSPPARRPERRSPTRLLMTTGSIRPVACVLPGSPSGDGRGRGSAGCCSAAGLDRFHKALSPEHRSWLGPIRVMEMEALSVATETGGRPLGHRLIEPAAAHYRGLGYRLMLGDLHHEHPVPGAPYYRRAGSAAVGAGGARRRSTTRVRLAGRRSRSW